jgi:hypothetical protein
MIRSAALCHVVLHLALSLRHGDSELRRYPKLTDVAILASKAAYPETFHLRAPNLTHTTNEKGRLPNTWITTCKYNSRPRAINCVTHQPPIGSSNVFSDIACPAQKFLPRFFSRDSGSRQQHVLSEPEPVALALLSAPPWSCGFISSLSIINRPDRTSRPFPDACY